MISKRFQTFLAIPALLVAGLLVQGHADAACTGNPLAARLPANAGALQGYVPALTDGIATQEGAQWNAPQAVLLGGAAPVLDFDLGDARPLTGAYLQADGNDLYTLSVSRDGKTYEPVWTAQVVPGHGLRTRMTMFSAPPVRYLRLTPSVGDGYYSVSELQVFCGPAPTPEVRIVQTTSAEVKQPWWNDTTSARWELVLALIALGLVLWKPLAARLKLKDRALAILGIVSFLTYFNFGSFHFPNFIHYWDSFHYYAGSKYFKELQYDRLYRCIAVADSEVPDLYQRVLNRRITNLQTNEMEIGSDVLADPVGNCKQHFTEGRWREFKHDVAFFRQREAGQRWEDLSTDHGYNATPVWTIAGSLLANTGPVSEEKLRALALLDPLYLSAAFVLIGWAFGWRVLAISLAIFASAFPSRYYWTGGSFLRWDWIFYTVAPVCLLRKQYFGLAGAALAYATLLRVFPGFMLVGAFLAFGIGLWKTRKPDRQWLRFFIGGIVASAILIPASVVVSGGFEAYPRFVQNTQKHKETPLTNHMGLRTVLSYRPDQVGRYLRDGSLLDPWSKWKEARLASYQQLLPLYALLIVGYLVLMGFAVRHQPPWVALALGATFIPLGVELTCYYYAFILAIAPLMERDSRVAPILLITSFAGQFFAAAPFPGMSGWFDEIYTWMSAVLIAAFAYISWLLLRNPGPDQPLTKPVR